MHGGRRDRQQQFRRCPVSARPRRRRRAWVVLTTASLTLAAAVVVAVTVQGSTTRAAAPPETDVVTAPVVRQTLTDKQQMSGLVGFGGTEPLQNQATGIYTSLPKPGAVIGNGEELYRVDNLPVTNMTGTIPAYRLMDKKMTGPDVEQLNAALLELGYLYYDQGDEFTPATASAVKAWQEDLGLPETGTVPLGQVVFTPRPVRIATVTPAVGDAASPGLAIFTTTGNVAQVTITTGATNRRYLRVGKLVVIGLPDGTSTTAKIISIGPVVTPESESGGPTVSAQAVLPKPKRAAKFQSATVDVTATTVSHKKVLTVPVTALLALREGGYAVMVDDATGRHLVPVKVGLIVGDMVEISGNVKEGMQVEVGSL